MEAGDTLREKERGLNEACAQVDSITGVYLSNFG